jgi:hypothetical protein
MFRTFALHFATGALACALAAPVLAGGLKGPPRFERANQILPIADMDEWRRSGSGFSSGWPSDTWVQGGGHWRGHHDWDWSRPQRGGYRYYSYGWNQPWFYERPRSYYRTYNYVVPPRRRSIVGAPPNVSPAPPDVTSAPPRLP